MQRLRLIVGLGNPGAEYAGTRHNAGFRCVDALADALGARFPAEAKLHAQAVRVVLDGNPLWLLKPATFMNRSGQAVAAALRYFKIDPAQMLVVHDDLDLPPGAARLKFDGGHGGQNGLRDILAHLGRSDFQRLRIGIGHPGQRDKVTPWVLSRPGRDDEAAIGRAIDEAIRVLPLLLHGETEKAMQQLHSARA